MVTSELQYKYQETIFDQEDMKCVRISSSDDLADTIVLNIMSEIFEQRKKLFKYISFLPDLDLTRPFLQEPITLYPGKEKLKIFTVSYPEIHAAINEKYLPSLLKLWTSTNYQMQSIYVAKTGDESKVYNILAEDVYKETYSVAKVWDFTDLIVLNEPNAEWHNTFVMLIHKKYYPDVCSIISKNTNVSN